MKKRNIEITVWLLVLIIFGLMLVVVGRLKAETSRWQLTEVMANPLDEKTGEWLELKYDGEEEVEINNWSIADKQEKDNLVLWPDWGKGEMKLKKDDLLLIIDRDWDSENDDWWLNDEVDLSRVVIVTTEDNDIGNGLNNNGEIFVLTNNLGQVELEISWEGTTDNGKSWEWVNGEKIQCDLEEGNTIGWLRSELVESTDNGEEENKKSDGVWQRFWLEGEKPVTINEILPNPVGDDKEEWLELVNNTKNDVDLSGWYLCDSQCSLEAKAGGYRIKETNLTGGGYILFKKTETGINLNNDGDEVILFDPNHQWVDAVSYDMAINEGQSLAREGDNWWLTDQITPGEKNVITGSLAEEEKQSDEKQTIDNAAEYGEGENIAWFKEQNDGSSWRMEGVVTVDYGLIENDGLWLEDETAGIMVKGKNLAGIKKGEKIIVYGKIDSLKYQKIMRVEQVERNGYGMIETISVTDGNLGKEQQDCLVAFTGEVTQKSSGRSFTIRETKVIVRDGIVFDETMIKVGRQIQVKGIVILTADGYKIYPTESSDIILFSNELLPQVGPRWW